MASDRPNRIDDDPRVTAVVTTYQRPELAKRAIISVFEQTYKPTEIVVVEDGSDSDLNEWLLAQGKPEVIYVRHDTNRGLAAARNTALRLAHGLFIAYLDDDDIWKPERLAKQVALVRSLTANQVANLAAVSAGFDRVIPAENRVSYAPPGNVGNLRNAIIREGAKTPSSTFLFRTEALRAIGGFDENLASSIDHDIWMGLAAKGYDAYAVDDALVVNYDRRGHATMMNSTVKRIKGVRQFVEKWTPTYREWLGDEQGERYMRTYFSSVIGNLAIGKLFEGHFREALVAVRAIYAQTDSWGSSSLDLLRQAVAAVARRLIPWRLRACVLRRSERR